MIRQGHVLDELPKIKAESIHCVVTSIPYWGLRDYKLPPQVWDDPSTTLRQAQGDGSGQGPGGCEHEWRDAPPRRSRSENEKTGNKQATNIGAQYNASGGQFCLKCNRWRGSLGLEPTIELYIQHIVQVFRELWRVMRKDGTVFLNIGDSYAGSGGAHTLDHANPGLSKSAERDGMPHYTAEGGRGNTKIGIGLKPKDLYLMPARVALALQADGWWLRSDIIWSKPNPMPESVTDRPTRSHEYVFLLTKSAHYFYDAEAVREPMAESSLQRISQLTFDRQTGGPKGPRHGGEGTRNRPARQALENLRDNVQKRSAAAAEYPGSRERDENRRRKKKQDALGKQTYTGFNARYAKNPVFGHNLRSVWEIATQSFPEAHFAAFPEKLVQRCIMAGTSERGCCPECGAPWERVVEKPKVGSYHDHSENLTQGARQSSGGPKSEYEGGRTTGWRPTCECGREDVKPCVILDPFLGSGTVGKVAQDLGRDWVGIELNPEYCEMAKKRTMHRQELLRLG